MKQYGVWKNGRVVSTPYPAIYAGIITTKIFGRLTCSSGARAKRENRVFFRFWEDAIKAGFRPCQNCNPNKFSRDNCDHMPFGLTGGMSLNIEKLRKRIRVTCDLCDKVLGYARQDSQGNVRWGDGFILPHDELIEANQ